MNTNKQTTIYLQDSGLTGPLSRFPPSVAITKELLELRVVMATKAVLASTTNTDAWHQALCNSDCCKWDLEGYLQK